MELDPGKKDEDALGLSYDQLDDFLEGKDFRGVYDGKSTIPMWLSDYQVTNFSHTYGFEPTSDNHMVPHYGIFSHFGYKRYIGYCEG